MGKIVAPYLATASKFQPKYAVMSDEKSAKQLKQLLANTSCKTEILSGSHAINEIAALDEADQVMSAIIY